MGSDIPQRKALKFLREHLHSQELFTKAELADVTGHFGGYSIYHVDERFRAWKLATHDEAMQRENRVIGT